MKSWSCIENCGACCQLDLTDRDDLSRVLSNKDIDLINNSYLRKNTSAIIAGPANATTAKGIRVAMWLIKWCDTIFTNKAFNCTNTLQDWIKLWSHGVV